jgi:hypothetical protein
VAAALAWHACGWMLSLNPPAGLGVGQSGVGCAGARPLMAAEVLDAAREIFRCSAMPVVAALGKTQELIAGISA